MVRLQKYLAECGVASRRACEKLIADGRVEVNGKPVTRQGISVDTEKDRVKVDGREVQPQKKIYIAVNKPKGYICTSSDPEGRPTVFDLLKEKKHHTPDVRLFSVGRLDYDSEGLILLTNDGEFANLLTHPRHLVEKYYLAWSDGILTSDHIRQLKKGVMSDGEKLRLKSIYLRKSRKKTPCYEVILGEGRNRQVRRMFKALGLRVNRLQRTQIGPLALGHLKEGGWRYLQLNEVNKLKRAARPKKDKNS